jgi:hypothetical protein
VRFILALLAVGVSVVAVADPPPAATNSMGTPPARAAAVEPSAATMKSLKEFLQTVDRHSQNKQLTYIPAFQDLNGDGVPEAIVYMMGPGWCGSGGCTTLILTPKGTSWKAVANTGVDFPPIYMLPAVSNGWHGIGVMVRDLRVQGEYEVELDFDGKRYPKYATLSTKRLEGQPVGQVIIASVDQGARYLYDNNN